MTNELDVIERGLVAGAELSERLAASAALATVREQMAEMEQKILTLRKRIHQIDGHNQFFERCESRRCNPIPTLVAGIAKSELMADDPATEQFGLAWKTPAEYDAKITALTREVESHRKVLTLIGYAVDPVDGVTGGSDGVETIIACIQYGLDAANNAHDLRQQVANVPSPVSGAVLIPTSAGIVEW